MKKQRLGVDVSGQIAAVGARVTQFKPGGAVVGICRRLCLIRVFSRSQVSRETGKPKFRPGGCCADSRAYRFAGTSRQGAPSAGREGEKVLINGAAGGVGTFAVQIGRFFGANITGVCSTKNVELVRSLGADRVIDYTCEDFTQDKERYDRLLDNVGNRPLSAMKRVLSPNGKCVMVGAPKELWPVLTRLLEIFTWSLFLRRKFTFFIARINRGDPLRTHPGRKINPGDRRYPLADGSVLFLRKPWPRDRLPLLAGDSRRSLHRHQRRPSGGYFLLSSGFPVCPAGWSNGARFGETGPGGTGMLGGVCCCSDEPPRRRPMARRWCSIGTLFICEAT
jgi:Zinc-binding dehydrogenase